MCYWSTCEASLYRLSVSTGANVLQLGTGWGCPPGAQLKGGKSTFPKESTPTCWINWYHFREPHHHTLVSAHYLISNYKSHFTWTVVSVTTSIAFCVLYGIINFLELSEGGLYYFPMNTFTSTSPHPVQNSACTLPLSSVPCFRCGCSYSTPLLTIASLTDSHHMLLTAGAQHSEFLMIPYDRRWSAVVIPGYFLPAGCRSTPWLGQRDFLGRRVGGGGDWRRFPEGVHQPYHHVFWAICEYSCHEMLSSS
jgi:hypothetical protein